jgi:hypothetical protein
MLEENLKLLIMATLPYPGAGRAAGTTQTAK